VVAALCEIDADVGRAVVRAVQPLIGNPTRSPAELATFGKRAVIIVPRSSALTTRAGVEFVPLPDGRALISFEENVSIPERGSSMRSLTRRWRPAIGPHSRSSPAF
jgi:hypothetical protein